MNAIVRERVFDSMQRQIDEMKLRADLMLSQPASKKEETPVERAERVFVVDVPLKKKRLRITNLFKKPVVEPKVETSSYLDEQIKRATAEMEHILTNFKQYGHP